jgi:flavorubredoxin
VLPTAPQIDPYRIADDTWVIPELLTAGPDALISVNSLVVAGAEPTIVDTGGALNRQRWLEQAWSLVDPADVRWVFISHDDADHIGNLLQVLDACPQATLVANWWIVERLRTEYQLPLGRCRWVNDGESFDAGDRSFRAILPPVFDSPATRGLFDSRTGALWAGDCFASLLTHPVTDGGDLAPEFWTETFAMVHSIFTPWHPWLDPAKFNAHVDRTADLNPSVIASAHGPVLRDRMIKDAFELIRELPTMEPRPMFGQADLDGMLAAMAAGG